MISKRISNEGRNYTRKLLREHKAEAKELKIIEESLRFPYKQTDENTGGGSAGFISNPVEAEFERVWTKGDFPEAVKRVKLIVDTFESLPDEIKTLVELKYFNTHGATWAKLAKETGYAEDSCKKKDRAAIDYFATKLNIR